MSKSFRQSAPALWCALGVLLIAGCFHEDSAKEDCEDQGGIWDDPFCFKPIKVTHLADTRELGTLEVRVTLTDGRILLAGDEREVSAACRIADGDAGKRSAVASMHFARGFASGVLLPDGRVLVDSGMRVGRAGHDSTVIADKVVRITGGAPERAGPDYFLLDELTFRSG